MNQYDLIVVGAGPAGSTCAALCAHQGGRIMILEAARFPRDKVCGDCLNPAVWPILDRLGLSSAVRALPSTVPSTMRFSVSGHHELEIPIVSTTCSASSIEERIVRRRDFDALLAARACEMGAEFRDGSPVTTLRSNSGIWEVTLASGETYHARRIVAADGRNSVIARLQRHYSPMTKDGRIGIQAHIPHPSDYDGALAMRIYRNGYGGLADIGSGMANLCLVANKDSMKELRREAELYYRISTPVVWRSITPISRSQVLAPARDGIYLCGDAARVVEPFTGEGISYALRSGALLADILCTSGGLTSPPSSLQDRSYRLAHAQLYGRNLWINRLTRFLSEHPRIAHLTAPLLLRHPSLLSFLTKKVLNPKNSDVE